MTDSDNNNTKNNLKTDVEATTSHSSAQSENSDKLEESKKRILIIDDDKMSSKFLAMRFEKKGYEVVCLNDETQYEEFIVQDFDLVLLDWLMPKISGLDVLKGIREKKKSLELPVIMVTANDEDKNIIEALNFGANDILVKPVNLEIAFARVKTQIELKDLSTAFQKQKEIGALNAMIVTYNHEINNPLTIALGYLNMPLDRFDEEKKEKCIKSLNRISEIVKKIENLDNLELVSYPGDSSMVKIS